MSALPQPKPGEGIVFCTHQMTKSGLTFRGGAVIRNPARPDALSGRTAARVAHRCRACKAAKDKDPHATIHGFVLRLARQSGREDPLPEDRAS